ncbi:hypothetical protein E2C01_028998 [Portunus trituberculatus]|uniref:Uncharacterized protein n=1 Tax=Portunus trituberculatus TaxID=210409 RepID=A0A5B7ERM4_PORTR|nr:hypothetical protein [Portunus trituberculatus]
MKPHHIAPHHTRSNHTTPHHTTPHRTAPHHTTPHHTSPHHTTTSPHAALPSRFPHLRGYGGATFVILCEKARPGRGGRLAGWRLAAVSERGAGHSTTPLTAGRSSPVLSWRLGVLDWEGSTLFTKPPRSAASRSSREHP